MSGDVVREQGRGRGSAERVDVRAAVRAYALPEPLERLVLDVVRRTRLWKREKVDVARELSAHFRDGLDSGTAPETLARDFGDPAKAAGLIRRATRRKRSTAYHIAARAGQGALAILGVAVVVHAGLAMRFYAGSPSASSGPAEAHNAAIERMPESSRAWPEYRRALLAMPAFPQSVGGRYPRLEPGEPGYDDAVAFIRAAGPELAVIREATRRPSLGATFAWDDDLELNVKRARDQEGEVAAARLARAQAELIESRQGKPLSLGLMPAAGHVGRLASHLRFEGLLAVREGNAGLFVDNVEAMVRLAEQVARGETLLEQIIGTRILAQASTMVRQVLELSPTLLDESALSRVGAALASAGGGFGAEIVPQIDAEGEMFRGLVAQTYTDDGRGSGRFTPQGAALIWGMGQNPSIVTGMKSEGPLGSPLGRYVVLPVLTQGVASRREELRQWDDLAHRYREVSQLKPWERTEDVRKRISPPWETLDAKLRTPVMAMVFPSLTAALDNAELARMERDAAVTAVALQRARLAQGSWPATLESLVPTFLPAVPVDGFTGRPLGYRVTPEGVRLYSTGGDGVDQDGTPPGEGVSVLAVMRWNRAVAGDWVLFEAKGR